MKLQNTRPGKANTGVWVNGTLYKLDDKSVVEVESQKDADELLADPSSWRKYVPRQPAEAPPAPPAPPKPDPKPTPEEKAADEPPASSEDGSDEAPEWPDPTMDMEIGYLREMATAYQVKHTKKTPKKALVAKITKAMYGDEE